MSFHSIWHNGLCLTTPRPSAKLMWSLQNHISLTSSVHPLIPPHGSVPSGRSGRSGAKSSVLRGVLVGKVSNVPSESVPSDKSSPHVYLRPLLEHLHAEIAKDAKSRSNIFGKMSAAINGAVRCVLAATFVRTGPPNFFSVERRRGSASEDASEYEQKWSRESRQAEAVNILSGMRRAVAGLSFASPHLHRERARRSPCEQYPTAPMTRRR